MTTPEQMTAGAAVDRPGFEAWLQARILSVYGAPVEIAYVDNEFGLRSYKDVFSMGAWEVWKAFAHSAPLVAVTDNWQPIETAPKDGTMVLICLPRQMNLIVRAWYNRIHKHWLYDYETDGAISRPVFFHEGDLWHPMPALPGTKKSDPYDHISNECITCLRSERDNALATQVSPQATERVSVTQAIATIFDDDHRFPQATLEPLTDEQIVEVINSQHVPFFPDANRLESEKVLIQFARALLAATPTASKAMPVSKDSLPTESVVGIPITTTSKADTVDRNAVLESAVKAMHKFLDRDYRIATNVIELQCETHDQAWNYLHEIREITNAAMKSATPSTIKAEPTGEQL